MHEEDYVVDDFDGFLRNANWVNTELEKGPPPPPAPAPSPAAAATADDTKYILVRTTERSPGRTAAVFVIGAVVGAVIMNFLSSDKGERAEEPQALAAQVESPPMKPETPKNAAADKPARAKGKPSREEGKQPAPVATNGLTPAEVTSLIASGQSAGLGNSALRINKVNLSYVKDGWGKEAPKLVVNATNTSDKTISMASVDARLYLNGSNSPAVTTSTYLFLGDRGLAPGATVEKPIYLSGHQNDDWVLPDVLNAKTKAAAIRITETKDGMKKEFGGSAPRLPSPL